MLTAETLAKVILTLAVANKVMWIHWKENSINLYANVTDLL